MSPSSISSNSKTPTVRVKRFKVSEDSSCYLLLDVKKKVLAGRRECRHIFWGWKEEADTFFRREEFFFFGGGC